MSEPYELCAMLTSKQGVHVHMCRVPGGEEKWHLTCGHGVFGVPHMHPSIKLVVYIIICVYMHGQVVIA